MPAAAAGMAVAVALEAVRHLGQQFSAVARYHRQAEEMILLVARQVLQVFDAAVSLYHRLGDWHAAE